MKLFRAHSQHIFCKVVWYCLLACVFIAASINAKAEDSAWEKFAPPPDEKFDWIQIVSGEWLKGEFKVLYDFEVEFDSDELDLLTFDLDDVIQLRTHKSQSLLIEDPALSDDPFVVEGFVNMIKDSVIVTAGEESAEFRRDQVVSIAQADKRQVDLWTGNITMGLNIRGGNTDTIDWNLQALAKRRTALSRVVLDYIGNYSEAERIETSNNHRLSGYRDVFKSRKFFWRQISAEYFSDPFKNIDNQFSLSTSAGYHIIHTSKTEWDVNAGIGARYSKFVSVEQGQNIDNTSPAVGAGTMYDTELSSWMDFLVDYSFQLLNKDSGTYNHHFITTLSTDLTGDIDLDISFVWDRTRDPQPDSDGVVPEQDDYQMIIGFSIDY